MKTDLIRASCCDRGLIPSARTRASKAFYAVSASLVERNNLMSEVRKGVVPAQFSVATIEHFRMRKPRGPANLTQRADLLTGTGTGYTVRIGLPLNPASALISLSTSLSASGNWLGRSTGAPKHSSPNLRIGTHQ